MSNFYNQSSFCLLQLMLIVHDQPNILYKKLLRGYSLDGSLSKILNGPIHENICSDQYEPTEKDIQNLKLFVYFLIAIFTNDRLTINLTTMTSHFLRTAEEILKRPNQEEIEEWEPTINKFFLLTIRRSSPICAVNYLLLNHSKQMSEIIKESIDYYQTNPDYHVNLNKMSNKVTTHDDKTLFSLDPEHLDKFSPFYFRSLSDYHSATKIYDQYYKSKDKFELEFKLKAGPFNGSKQELNEMLCSLPITQELVSMLLKIVQLKVENESPAINEEILEFTLYLFAYFAFNEDMYKKVNNSNISIRETIVAYSETFKKAQEKGEHPIFQHIFNDLMGSDSIETKSNVFKKANIAQKKAKIMEKMKKKRNKIIKNITEDQDMPEVPQVEIHKCTL